jgi:hypothetical protein
MAAWVSCGLFTYLPAAGFTTYTDTEDALASYIGAPADPLLWSDAEADRITAMEAQIPPAVLAKNGDWASNNSNDYHAAHLSIVDEWDDVQYALQNVTFNAIDAVSSDPIDNTTCQLSVWVTDLGNNGLPQALVIPPEVADPAVNDDPYEVPDFGYDLVANGGAGIEQLNIKVGEPEIELSLTGDTALAEGTNGNLELNISPAEHGPFTVTFSTVGTGAVVNSDYIPPVSVNVPEDATVVQVPVNAADDNDVDPGEFYTVSIDPTVTGYQVTLTDPSAVVSITDTDGGIDVDPPTASIGQALGQLDPTSFLPIIFTVVFSEPVTGFGDEDSDVSFVGSTAGGILAANVTGSGDTYEVEVTGATTSGLVKISVPAGAGEDAGGNPSDAAIPGDNSVQYVKPAPGDVTKPTVTINQAAGQVSPANVEPVVFDIVFSEPVVGLSPGDVVLNGTAIPNVVSVTGSGAVYQAFVTNMIQAGTITAVVVADAAMDASGNTSFASTSTDNSVDWIEPDPGDTTGPTVVVDKAQLQADPTSSSPIVFDVEFNEQVVGFDASDVTFGGTALPTGITVSGVGPAYEVKVTGMSVAGDVTISIPAAVVTDAAGNDNDASTAGDDTVEWQLPAMDVTPPTGTIDQAGSQADPTSFDPIKFAVIFSEPVTGLTASDIVLSGTNAGTLVPTVNGSGDTYEISVGGMNGDGTVIANIGAGAVNDLAGNPNAALTFTDNSVNYLEPPVGDVTPPHGDIHLAPGQGDPTSVSPVVFEISFDEEVSDFADDDILLAGSANPTAAVVSGSGPYLVTVSGMNQSGQVNIGLKNSAVFDSVGNVSGPPTNTDNSVNYTFNADVTGPNVLVNQQLTQDDPTSISPIMYDVVFDEPVVDFDASDFQFDGTALPTTAVITGAGPAYVVAVSGMSASGTVMLSINANQVHDAANNGNGGSGTTDNTVDFVLDTTPPTVTVEKDSADPTTSSPVVFTVQFSEAVSGLAATDFDTSASTVGGSLNVSVLMVDADTYTVSVDGMTAPAGNVVLSLPASKVVDAANLANTASTSVDNIVAWSPDLGPLAFDFVPADINVQAAEGDSGANVTFATPTATGGVPPVTVNCDAASGDFFPIGTTTVTCTAQDSAEIQMFALVMASFDITVTAAPPPPGGGLPSTGVVAGPLTSLALLLLASGGLVLLFVRRRTA